MRRIMTITSTVLAAAVQPAHGGAIERTTQSTAILFEAGRYAEVSFGHVGPSISGAIEGTPMDTGGGVVNDYWQFASGFKMPVTPDLDLALVVDQPIGADLGYPAGAFYPIAGTTASIDATAVTLMGRYRLPGQDQGQDRGQGLSLIGGLRAQTTSGSIRLPVTTATGIVLPYAMGTSTETDWGYLLGLAYERPETGLRVALTYNSEIRHDFGAAEVTALGDFATVFQTIIPQSVNLEAQTGVAEDTLLFGSVRWVDWSAFAIDPVAYRTRNPANPSGDTLVSYSGDYTTYTLGLGRRFDDTWSAAVSASHEAAMSGPASNLAPTNGYTSLQAALIYTAGPLEVTGLLRYLSYRSLETQRIGARFAGNDVLAAGLRLGYRF